MVPSCIPRQSTEAPEVADPAIEAQPPRPAGKAIARHRADLSAFLADVSTRAGATFDAMDTPGRCADTLEALKAWARHGGFGLSIQSEGTLDRAREKMMGFGRGARETTFYRDTFPEWFDSSPGK